MDKPDNLISYWKPEGTISMNIYSKNERDDFFVIYGFYDHCNGENPRPAVGVCWGDYPKIRNTIAPIALPYEFSINVLNGMLLGAVIKGDIKKSQQIQKGIDFLVHNREQT